MTEVPIDFTSSSGHSIGVEIEFQVIHSESFELVPLAPVLHEQAPKVLQPRISQELIKSILELQTGICRNLRDVENDLLQTAALAEELAADNGCLLYAASLHPFAIAEEQELSSDARYRRIMEELQIIGRRFISQGLHVHIGVPDGNTAVEVCNVIQGFLPVFLVLSSSSPFYQGKDTGLHSYRTKLFESLPLAGMYEHLENWHHFSQEVAHLVEHGVIESVKDLWWDARPSPGFGTVEIRICDLPSRFSDILAIVALIQASIAWIVDEKITCGPLNPYLMKYNKWQAVRHGLNGRFIDPTGLIGEEAVPYASATAALVDKVQPHSVRLEGLTYLEKIGSIVSEGTAADMQRRVYHKTGDFKEVIRSCQKRFWE